MSNTKNCDYNDNIESLNTFNSVTNASAGYENNNRKNICNSINNSARCGGKMDVGVNVSNAISGSICGNSNSYNSSNSIPFVNFITTTINKTANNNAANAGNCIDGNSNIGNIGVLPLGGAASCSSSSQIGLLPPIPTRKKGAVIGDYTIYETIGKGTFGKVKRGVHNPTGERVAVKILNRLKLRSANMDAKISREIRILQLFHHPNICRLYEVIQTQSDIFLILEYVEGGELFDFIIKENGNMSEAVARYLFQQIVCALEYCHHFRVAHRDLKPENILLGPNMQVKVIDFGLSNLMLDGKFLMTSCGSPNYAAPEVITGKLYAGPEVDVWSCGVVLYALLCGRLPFDDDHTPKLFAKIKEGKYEIPLRLSADASELISQLIVVDPLCRSTIPQIRDSAWFSTNLPSHLRYNADSFKEREPVNTKVVAQVADILGNTVPDNVIRKQVEARRGRAYITYTFIMDKKSREELSAVWASIKLNKDLDKLGRLQANGYARIRNKGNAIKEPPKDGNDFNKDDGGGLQPQPQQPQPQPQQPHVQRESDRELNLGMMLSVSPAVEMLLTSGDARKNSYLYNNACCLSCTSCERCAGGAKGAGSCGSGSGVDSFYVSNINNSLAGREFSQQRRFSENSKLTSFSCASCPLTGSLALQNMNTSINNNSVKNYSDSSVSSNNNGLTSSLNSTPLFDLVQLQQQQRLMADNGLIGNNVNVCNYNYSQQQQQLLLPTQQMQYQQELHQNYQQLQQQQEQKHIQQLQQYQQQQMEKQQHQSALPAVSNPATVSPASDSPSIAPLVCQQPQQQLAKLSISPKKPQSLQVTSHWASSIAADPPRVGSVAKTFMMYSGAQRDVSLRNNAGWRIGVMSDQGSSFIMSSIYKVLIALNMEWKTLSSHHIATRFIAGATYCDGSYRDCSYQIDDGNCRGKKNENKVFGCSINSSGSSSSIFNVNSSTASHGFVNNLQNNFGINNIRSYVDPRAGIGLVSNNISNTNVNSNNVNTSSTRQSEDLQQQQRLPQLLQRPVFFIHLFRLHEAHEKGYIIDFAVRNNKKQVIESLDVVSNIIELLMECLK